MNSLYRKTSEREKVITELYARGFNTSPEISEKTGIPERTVRRYLKIIKDGNFVVDGMTPEDYEEESDATIEYLLSRQEVNQSRSEKERDQHVYLTSDRPVSVTLFSDIHWGSPTVDYKSLVRDTGMVRDEEGAYAFCLGDLGENWVGTLSGISAEQEVTINQEKSGIEGWLGQLSENLPVVVSGNHDNRTKYLAHIDYVQQMCRGLNLLYGSDQVIFDLHLGDAVWRWKCRHQFKGSSQWNETHAIEKNGKLYDGFDFGAHGHFHRPTIIRPYYQSLLRKVCYACNIGTYKISDDYATRLGFENHHTEYTATIIYYPDGRVVVPNGSTLEENLRYLRWARKNF